MAAGHVNENDFYQRYGEWTAIELSFMNCGKLRKQASFFSLRANRRSCHTIVVLNFSFVMTVHIINKKD